jgi:hypothetical protein
VRRAVAGKHEYTSMDAAMAAGAAVGTVFGESFGQTIEYYDGCYACMMS